MLATDMGVHNDFMNKFAKLLETWNGDVDWQAAKSERQEFICKLLLKNADISNPVSLTLWYFTLFLYEFDILESTVPGFAAMVICVTTRMGMPI